MTALAAGVAAGSGSIVRDLLGGKKRVRVASAADPLIYNVEFDATISEKHSGEAEPTDHPVEGKTDMTDHVRRKPESLELQSVVSDTPIVILPLLNAKPSVPGTDPQARVKAAYDLLVGFKDAAELLTVSTTLRDYANMVIVSMSTTRDKESGNILDLTLKLREIQIATTETIAAVKLKSPAAAKGAQSGKAADSSQEQKAGSVLNRLVNFVAGS